MMKNGKPNMYERAMLVYRLRSDYKKVCDKIRELSSDKRSLAQKLDIAIDNLKGADE